MRRSWAIVTLVALAVGVGVTRADVGCDVWTWQPDCYVSVAAGPTLDARRAVLIDGVRGAERGGGLPGAAMPGGAMIVTTIAVEDALTARMWWASVRSPARQTLPRARLFPAGMSTDALRDHNRVVMADSQRVALAAAQPHVAVPLGEVRIDAGEIGGPSAGLVFALAVIDLLGEAALVEQGAIAGTGALDADGRVRPVGGVALKAAAASRLPEVTAFLLPRANLDEARDARVVRDLLLVPVDDVDGALSALAALRAGTLPADAWVLAAP